MRTYDDLGNGGGIDVITKWFLVGWSYTEPPPTGLLTGFEAVIFTGTDPTITANYITPIKQLLASDRTWISTYRYRQNSVPVNVNAAVRAVYPWGKSPWVNVGSTTNPADPPYSPYQADNLIPNPTSELGAIPGYGGILVVNDAGNSYNGTYCRKLDASATHNTILTPRIPCVYTDQFIAECYVKSSNTSPALGLVLTFYDQSGASVGSVNNITYTQSTSYQPIRTQGTVPLGAVSVQLSAQAAVTANSTFLYFDNLSLRRSVRFAHLESDAAFRTINALKNTGATTGDRTYYAGNNDLTVRGGAPNISALTVIPQVYDTTLGFIHADLTTQPTQPSDNLDGMRYALVTLYNQSARGTTGTLTAVGKPFKVPLADRLFANSTDSNSANAGGGVAVYNSSGILNFPAMKVTIYNALGPSDTHCFYSNSTWAAGNALTDNGTAWPAGLTGGTAGGTGGGAGGGGGCPEIGELIDLPKGAQKAAGQIQPGDLVWTMDPNNGTIGQWPVLDSVTEDATDLWIVNYQDGRSQKFKERHRFRLQSGGWCEIQDLQPDMVVDGTLPGVVASVSFYGAGQVQRITVDQVHTYMTSGLLSSNVKTPTL